MEDVSKLLKVQVMEQCLVPMPNNGGLLATETVEIISLLHGAGII